MKAVSIRNPWAWLIVNGYKDVENRNWFTYHRGPILIHASVTIDRVSYFHHIDRIDPEIILPPVNEIEHGGIIGIVDIINCVSMKGEAKYPSKWAVGPYGWILANPRKVKFIPMDGRLMIFNTDIELSNLKFT